ncbi:terminase large subunit [Ralstonia phage Reminis]|uniref:Terminase large subunit n=1 Tax=Ralstonia phage Reminis TaxID=2662139 RepID=A0A5Q2UAM7_9CAUD|nr:terminase large subunit [Ralstonia phage Reminis]
MEDELLKLVVAAKQAKVDIVYVEKNFGNGAHFAMLKPLFEKHYPECRLEEINSTGQKELRIIDTLEPLLGQHRLIVSQQVVMEDYQLIQHYPAEVKMTYSLFYQMGHITSDRNSLRHDDRIDALAGAVAQIIQYIDYDQARAEKERTDELERKRMAALADPDMYVQFMRFGLDSVDDFVNRKGGANALSKYF